MQTRATSGTRVAPSGRAIEEAVRRALDAARRRRGRIPGRALPQVVKDCGKPHRALFTQTLRAALSAAITDPTFAADDLLGIVREQELVIRLSLGEAVPDLATAMRDEQHAQLGLDEMQWCVAGPHTAGDLDVMEQRAFAQRDTTDRLILAIRQRRSAVDAAARVPRAA
jgi:hypothetical protein